MGKKRSKKGKTVKNNPNNAETEPEELSRAPHSFVIHRGSVGRTIVDYTKDFRKVMEPFTASSLKVRKKNVLKDFAAVAGLLHVSHLVMFTSTETASYVRFGRFPRGPTLTFRMLKYSLSREVLSQLRKQYAFDKAFRNFPLVVLNNFSGEGAHMKLMATMFQNMFPTINLTKVNLDSVRRCVLFNYNHEDKTVEFRHYGIRVAPVGLSRGVKKLIQSKVPNLSRYEDVSEFLLKGEVSESEAEDDGESHVTLPQKISSRGNVQDGQSAIRLSELGPRMTLQLIKVEGGLCEGEVIYHDLIKKTPKEISLINKRREQKRKLKEERKRIQEKNIERKQRENLSKKEKKTVKFAEDSNVPQVENDNDSEWYRKEVGQDPDKELFNSYKSSGIKRKYPYKGSSDTKNKVSKPDFNQFGRKRPYNSSSDGKSKRSKPDFNQGGRKYPYKDSSDRKGQRSKPDFSQGGNRRAKQFQPKSFKNKKVLGSKVRKGQRHR